MSTTIAPKSEPTPRTTDFRRYGGTVWRVVEGQHRISTGRLADEPGEQSLLEALAEEVKPRMPAAARQLHPLLATPFRYGHSRGSRFRAANERPGIFYASEAEATAIAEAAYYRIRFFARSPGVRLPTQTVWQTSFNVRVACARALDLTSPPLSHQRRWTDPDDHEPCQRFAAAARAIGAQLIRYQSVRDPEQRANVALLDPAGFAASEPILGRTWHFRFEAGRLAAVATFPPFERYTFEIDKAGIVAPPES
jgi:hypothetical protein